MFITVQELQKFYGEDSNRVEVLKKVELGIEAGEICVVLGPSGSGKSTLLNIIGGIEQADGGSVFVAGNDICRLSVKNQFKYRKDNLGFVFQSYNLVPNLTVRENIEVGAYLSSKPLATDRILSVLGLTSHKDKFPNQLSGGQQQRCAIGRALIKNPSLLLLDEPTGALDYSTAREIMGLIESLNREYHTTMLMVTHNEAIKKMAHRVLYMHDGHIVRTELNTTRVPASEIEW